MASFPRSRVEGGSIKRSAPRFYKRHLKAIASEALYRAIKILPKTAIKNHSDDGQKVNKLGSSLTKNHLAELDPRDTAHAPRRIGRGGHAGFRDRFMREYGART